MNAQITVMTVPLKLIAQTTRARLSVPAVMAFKETEKHVRVRTHSERALQTSSLPATIYVVEMCKDSLKGW